eukprot:gene13602-18256_t
MRDDCSLMSGEWRVMKKEKDDEKLLAVIALCLIASAAAFTPAAAPRSMKVVPTMAAERSKSMPFLIKPPKLDGTLAGDEGFDPLGLSNIEDLGLDLYWFREAELKHCRVAMLAVVGLLAQEAGFVLPGAPVGKDQVEVFWTVFDRNPGPIFAGFIFSGFVEIISGIATTEGRKSGNRAPGEFGFNPLKLGKSPAAAKDYALKEVRNGRLAMFAAAGLLLQGATTGKGALENLF